MSASRTPTEAREPRMGPLARLPVFFALAGKRVVLAGGTPAAAWKAELLSAAGAEVDVLTSELSDEMRSAAADPPPPEMLLTTAASPLDLNQPSVAFVNTAASGERPLVAERLNFRA